MAIESTCLGTERISSEIQQFEASAAFVSTYIGCLSMIFFDLACDLAAFGLVDMASDSKSKKEVRQMREEGVQGFSHSHIEPCAPASGAPQVRSSHPPARKTRRSSSALDEAMVALDDVLEAGSTCGDRGVDTRAIQRSHRAERHYDLPMC